MVKIPKRVSDRFAATLKNYQGIAISQKDRDVSEADTVTLVKDVLAYVFGYDKYTELTGIWGHNTNFRQVGDNN